MDNSPDMIKTASDKTGRTVDDLTWCCIAICDESCCPSLFLLNLVHELNNSLSVYYDVMTLKLFAHTQSRIFSSSRFKNQSSLVIYDL